MLENYNSKINTHNGVYIITDINYDFSTRGRDITLKCTECGRVIHRTMIRGRNKWSELIKTCPCQKLKRQEEFEKFFKNKKDIILSETEKACKEEKNASTDLNCAKHYVRPRKVEINENIK